MTYSHEVERMCPLTNGPNNGPAPIPEEGQWVKAYQISDISGLTHGVGWCAPQQGTCKLTLNVKGGVDKDKIAAGIKIIMTNPRVEGILINILGGFLRCNLIADGIVAAASEVGLNVPLVVRFEGTNKDEAKDILEHSKLPIIIAEDMEDSVNKLITAMEESD